MNPNNGGTTMGNTTTSKPGSMASTSNEDKLAELKSTAQEKLGDFKTMAQEKLGDFKSMATDKVGEAREYVRERGLRGITQDIADSATRNPLQAVAISVGVGYVLGRLMTRK